MPKRLLASAVANFNVETRQETRAAPLNSEPVCN